MSTNTPIPSEPELLLTRSQVAQMLGVSPTTVTRWAREGRLPCRLTLGGHHRYSRGVIETIRARMTGRGSPAAFPAAKPLLEVRS
jgi:excisionase family DNA binding protein